jgi:hypothetical protein
MKRYYIETDQTTNEYATAADGISYPVSSWIALHDTDEVIAYCEDEKKRISIDVLTIINADHDRLDELEYSSTSMAANVKYCMALQKNPLTEANDLILDKAHKYFDMIDNNEVILINKNGGHRALWDDAWIVKVEDSDALIRDVVYRDSSRYVVLENDAAVDEWTINHFGEAPFSSICSLRDHMDDLTNLLDTMAEQDVDTVFVYTTGIDRVQMMQYIQKVEKSKINRIEFHIDEDVAMSKEIEIACLALDCRVYDKHSGEEF